MLTIKLFECSLEKYEERDIKGLYKKARNNEIKNFTATVSDII
jgi:adenylylsulfate kinase-like enzyme